MHYIADAATHLAEHPDAQHAQYAMHGAPQDASHHHSAVHQDAQQGAPQDYAGEPFVSAVRPCEHMIRRAAGMLSSALLKLGKSA